MKNLKLDRPIAFIDVETTGLSPSWDRIIELAVLKVHPNGTEELNTVRINPEMPIPPETSRIHGITDGDVADKPRFKQYASSLRDFFGDCDIGGFGVKRLALPILEAEFRRAGVKFSRGGRRIIDAQVIFHKLEPRDLSAAYRKYCGKELEDGRTSQGHVRAAGEVLDAQLQHYLDLPRDVAGLHDFCEPREPHWIDAEGKFVWSEQGAAFGFGQYKGKLLKEIASLDPDYLDWIAGGDFSDEVKKLALDALSGRFPKPPEPLS